MYKKIFLDIDFRKFLAIDLPNASTCIKHQVVELKDIHDKFADGFPKSYCFENTKIHQKLP